MLAHVNKPPHKGTVHMIFIDPDHLKSFIMPN